MKRTLLALGLVLAGSGAAFAYGPSTPGVDVRQHNQAARIHQGMRDGSLTHRESARLIEQQRTHPVSTAGAALFKQPC